MKRQIYFSLFIFAICNICALSAFSQGFNYTLTGNPVDITGWTMGTESTVNGDRIDLTAPIGNQAGYIYYSTPSTLTGCSQFTVTFDFRITESSFPTADGIAFWYISNPPDGFTTGGGIGLPNDPDGLVLILDTYNNFGTSNVPLVSLRHFDGTVNYVEDDPTGQVVSDVTNQSWITDGNWHTCVLTYYYGNITVAFDGNAPVMSGTTSLDGLSGYFGFTAGTGASYSRQSIRNVSIVGAPIPPPPSVNDVTYCLNAPADSLTATGDDLHWYTTPTGGTPLGGAPTPSTSTPGIFTWYVSQYISGCDVESERAAISVYVSSPPNAPTVDYITDYCTGQDFTPFVVNGSDPLWYDSASGGTGSPTAPVVNTETPGSYTWYVSQTVNGCESIARAKVTVTVHQTPVPDFDSVINLGCAADTVHLNNTSQYATEYEWNFGDGSALSNNVNPAHVYNAQGIYNIKLVARAGMCADSITKQVDLNHPLQASFAVNDDTLCVGDPFTVIDFSTTTLVDGIAPSYYWDFGDGNTATSLAPITYSYSQAGSYDLMLVVTDGVPCSDTFIKTITVDSAATITLKQSDTMICTGDQVTLNASYTQNGFQDLLWVFGSNNDTVMGENPITRAYDIAGNYSITAIAQYRACPAVNAITHIRVNPMPVINIGQDDSLCYLGNPILLVDSANLFNPNAKWQWSNGDTSGIVTIVHPGTYTASVDVDGCVTTDQIIIYKDCYIDVPNSFTPNGDGVNDYFFPRQFLSSGVIAFKMAVYNRWGQKIYETDNINGRGWDGKFNSKDQPEGVYVYIIDVTMKNYRQEHYTGNVTLLR